MARAASAMPGAGRGYTLTYGTEPTETFDFSMPGSYSGFEPSYQTVRRHSGSAIVYSIKPGETHENREDVGLVVKGPYRRPFVVTGDGTRTVASVERRAEHSTIRINGFGPRQFYSSPAAIWLNCRREGADRRKPDLSVVVDYLAKGLKTPMREWFPSKPSAAPDVDQFFASSDDLPKIIKSVAAAIYEAMDLADSLDCTAAETYAKAAIKATREALREPSDDLMNAFRCASKEEWRNAIDMDLLAKWCEPLPPGERDEWTNSEYIAAEVWLNKNGYRGFPVWTNHTVKAAWRSANPDKLRPSMDPKWPTR